MQLRVLDPNKFSNPTKDLMNTLKRRIVGQEDSVSAVVDIVERFQAGFCNPERPAGNALFLGPTGTGKTLVAESLAEGLFGDKRACMKIDCAEFQHSHEIAKLIGSPPGYLGHRETHPMITQEALNQWHTDKIKLSILLFDEIEKASDALWNLLLGILDKATLVLGDNRRVSFQQVVIIMTSNLGASEMAFAVEGGMGYRPDIPSVAALQPKLKDIAIAAAKRKFSPEFYNRLDNIVVFQTLTEEQIKEVVTRELGHLQQRIFMKKPLYLNVLPKTKKRLLAEGYSPKFGARFLIRTIQKYIEIPLARMVASGQLKDFDEVRIADTGGEQLEFAVVERTASGAELAL